ncbi:MAG: mercuric reductase [Elusimicrobia bacterium]|nr:mercuric reductase [Elusimicrobiota bacterium]
MTAEFEPRGEHDARLLERVRPAGRKNPEPAPSDNLVVVGGGPAGLVAASGAAGLGAKVALVEKRMLGGDCLNFGCVPSKALVRAGRAAADAKAATSFGVNVFPGASIDFPAVMERVRAVRAELSANDSAERFEKLGVDVFYGEPEFVGRQALVVDQKTLRFARAVLCTGARPNRIPIPGLWESGARTNESIFQLTATPKRLLVIGAGPIGVELAQAFARLGVEVTLLEAQHGLLPREDAEAAAIVRRALEADGVRFRCCVQIASVALEGAVRRVRFASKHGDPETADFEEILAGAGRVPNVEGLGLDAAGVSANAQGVVVDDFLRTTNPHIFAAGDVCLSSRFTHAADAAARLAIQNALFFGRRRWSSVVIPSTVYSDPELAHVGVQASDAVDTFAVPLSEVDRAVLDGETSGLLKLHVEKGTDKIAGATVVARHAGDLINELSSTMTNGVGLKALAQVVRCYPTQSEALKRAADAYNRTRLTPTVKAWLGRWLDYNR